MIRIEVRGERVEGGRLAELYVRHGPAATRLAYLLTGSQALAEDLVQEAFVRLAGRFRDIRDQDALEPYLRRTVVNLARMHFRHLKVERAYVARVGSMAPQAHEAGRDLETHEAMKAALLRLPMRQRAALVLRFYEDMPDRQIADLLRCRPGTVRSLISRGVAALRSSVKTEATDG